MSKILIGVIVGLVIAAGVYFAVNSGLTVSFNKPLASPVASSLQVVSPEETSTPVASPTANENDSLIAAVKAGLITEHGQDAASMTITISKVEGDYAKGMASAQGGGGIWFAAKVAGAWKLVFDGNGIITCDVLTPYPAFPTTLIPTCWDSPTNKLLTR